MFGMVEEDLGINLDFRLAILDFRFGIWSPTRWGWDLGFGISI